MQGAANGVQHECAEQELRSDSMVLVRMGGDWHLQEHDSTLAWGHAAAWRHEGAATPSKLELIWQTGYGSCMLGNERAWADRHACMLRQLPAA